MERPDMFPTRLRRLAIATGVASALALFPIFFLLYPALLIVGGFIQPRFPDTGRWFIWVGASLVSPMLIMYDVMIIRDAFSSAPYTSTPLLMTLTFPPATILLVWCYEELVADALQRMRARRSMPQQETRPVSLGVWILVAFLNLSTGWSAYGFLSWHRHFGDLRIPLHMLALPLVEAVIVVVSDIYLISRVIKLRRAGSAALPMGGR